MQKNHQQTCYENQLAGLCMIGKIYINGLKLK